MKPSTRKGVRLNRTNSHRGRGPKQPGVSAVDLPDTFEGRGEELARCFEETFKRNGWPPAWRYTIYDYPHYHSTTHEVIGIFRGEAEVRFGMIPDSSRG